MATISVIFPSVAGNLAFEFWGPELDSDPEALVEMQDPVLVKDV
jgi:hypothetical protein